MVSVLFSLLLVFASSFCMDKPLHVDGRPTLQLKSPTDLEKHGYYKGTPGTRENHYFSPGQEDELLFTQARLAKEISDKVLFQIRYTGIQEKEVKSVKRFSDMQEHIESYEATMNNGDTVWCFHWNSEICKSHNMWQKHFPQNNVTSAIRLFNSIEIPTKLPINPAITLEVLRKISHNTQK